MRKIFTLQLFLALLFLAKITNATNYYLSPAGNDNNSGTISSPWKTFDRLSSAGLVAGDIVYVRGGTYRSTKAASVENRFQIVGVNGTSGNPVRIENYPGESPVINLDDILCTGSGPTGLYIISCSYIVLKGIRITGLAQNPGGGPVCGLNITNSPNSIIENIEVDHCGGYGFYNTNSNNNLFLNCDAHDLDDRYSGWTNANGFNCTGGDVSTGVIFRNCRAWWCSDDGFDLFSTNGLFTFENCWSFWNGYQPGTFSTAGDGTGFKFGPNTSNQSGNLRRIVKNCLSFQNRLFGYDQNSAQCRFELYNNSSFGNGVTGYNFPYHQSITHQSKNNLSHQDPNTFDGNNIQGSFNSWNGGVTVNNADFLSVSVTGVDGPRQADGSLPNLNFIKLVTSSDLINAGVNVGIPYNGAAPDLGAFETGGTAPPPSNQTPTANAGTNKNITLPTSSITQAGSGTDPDGTIAAYQWTKIAGPAQFTIVSPTLAQTVINNLVQGVYQFELRVTDNLGATDTDTMQVTVNPSGVNQPPTANAGTNKNITLPTSSITQTGSGTDPDGTIAAYQWTKIAGPAQFTIVSPTLAQTVINNLVQGVYQFELRVVDNLGAADTDTMQVTVNAAANQPPLADAGTDKNITLPTNSITQTGSGSDPDGTIATYQWTKIAGPSQYVIVSPAQAQTVINNLAQGVYQFELRVTDNLGATATDIMTITVNPAVVNQPPVANAGVNRNITLPVNSFTQTGSGTDPDGTISAYQWTKVSGPAQFTIVSPNQAQTVINNLVQGVYQFELRVTDNLGATGTDIMTVTVNAPANQPPTANAGANNNITLPVSSITQTGSGTDPDGTISAYLWTKISGPAQFTIVSPTQAQTVINNLVQGVYQFELRVTDNLGATDTDIMTVTVNAAVPANQPPVANAGVNRNITLPVNSFTQTGSGTDPDGTISAYQWTKVSGPAQFTIVSPNQAQTVINNLVQGVYQFELRVTDNLGATDIDIMTVTVNAPANQLPTADAGANKNITLPVSSITQTGSGTDPDGTISAYLWTKISGPAQFTIVSPTQAQTVINNLVQGVYQFELRVTDNLGATDTDIMTVTVNAAVPANQPPVANAGANQTILLPVNSVTQTGSGTDPDGTISAYLWTKISGPAQFTIVSPAQAQTVINNLVQGVYQFQLRVTDNLGATGTSIVTITVNPDANQRPVADAGDNQTITLPSNSITQTGSGTDADGIITAYQWKKIAGPVQYTIVSPTLPQTEFINLEKGVYRFELSVTDNLGSIGKDTVTIEVIEEASLIAQVYPNPVVDKINIRINPLKDPGGKLKIRVYDSRGIIIFEKEISAPLVTRSEEIDMAKYQNGFYIVEIITGKNQRETMKFVKQ